MFKPLFLLALTAAAAMADYLPLANGNWWLYRDAVTGSTFEIRVSTPSVIRGKVYHSVRGMGPAPLLLRTHESGNIVLWDEEKEIEKIVTSFETQNVGDFEAYGRQCPATGRAQKELGQYQGPAGIWPAAEVRLQPYGCADAGETQELYAANVGLLRRVTNTIIGPRVFDLVQARIGKQVISASETGRFSITAIPGPGVWNVSLYLDLPLGTSIPVVFPSGQTYDLRLRGPDGVVIYTWSATRLFTQGVRNVTLQGGWTDSTTVPYPPGTRDRRTYSLEAWFTTAQGQPQFAAATTVEAPVTPLANARRRR
jgi:hypothetical protein